VRTQKNLCQQQLQMSHTHGYTHTKTKTQTHKHTHTHTTLHYTTLHYTTLHYTQLTFRRLVYRDNNVETLQIKRKSERENKERKNNAPFPNCESAYQATQILAQSTQTLLQGQKTKTAAGLQTKQHKSNMKTSSLRLCEFRSLSFVLRGF
jgi:hypothetical protein